MLHKNRVKNRTHMTSSYNIFMGNLKRTHMKTLVYRTEK